MEEKVKQFNLLPINQAMALFLNETFPKFQAEAFQWDYVKFHQAMPYFYSRSYIEEHTIDELQIAFSSIAK